MKCIKILIVLMAVMFGQGVMFAQEGQTENTHAHSESMKWKGIDVNDVLGNSQYETNGKKIYLYNVGTGRFIIEGGNWGMEGRLFHETFGRPLFLLSNGLIKSGIKENGSKDVFGCNAPKDFHDQQNWANYDQFSFTMMMDANSAKRKRWFFERVETEGDTCTYYMYEEPKPQNNTKRYYFGAVYGDWKKANSNTETDTLVYRDYDRATWTTEVNVKNITEKYEVKEEFKTEMIPLNELYQWRLVPEDEFLKMLDNENIGLNPSVSVQIYDRDFTRNAEQFSTNWKTETRSGANYSLKGRYGFTFGTTGNKYGAQTLYNDKDAWNKPLRLKNIFEKSKAEEPSDAERYRYGLPNGKYGFLTFEGVGRTYTEVEVPRAGWYLVQCYGFVYSESEHNAYLFAKVKGSQETSSTGGESKINLRHIDTNTLKNEILTGKNDREKCLEVGKFLTKPKTSESVGETKEDYLNTVWICVTEEQFKAGTKTLQIGIGKDEATQSEGIENEGKTYYYDTDWVCIDDFRMSYLGLRPAFFYEDEEDFNYIIPATNNTKQYRGASPTGQYGGAVSLERSFKTGQWNSFSFPMPLTGEQVRYAFGEDASLAKLHSVGSKSQNPDVIDFVSVSLFTTNNVVEPGNFYLLKPTKNPAETYDPRADLKEYYDLGRKFFSVKENEEDTYTHFRLSTTTLKGEQEVTESFDEKNSITATANYVQTPDFANFRVSKSDGLYTGSTAQGYYAPKGSYVVSNNTIVHLNKDNPLKGFRGWIKLAQELTQESKEFTMEVFGMFDEVPEQGGTTSVPRIHLFTADESVYDLYGRKVGKLGDILPKGIYIVKGKKYMVK